MRAVAFVAVLIASTAALADLGERCRASCLRHVKDPRQQATVCGRCVLDGDAGGWVPRASVAPADLLEDPDWEVRWAGLRLKGKAKQKGGPEAALGEWILATADERRVLACATAVHIAGRRVATLEALLAGAPDAKKACVAVLGPVKSVLEPELYDTDAPVRNEALAHLASALGVGSGRVLLDAVRSRPAVTDGAAAQLLLEAAQTGGPPAGLALLRAAGPGDEDAMNRLLAIYSALRDRSRPLLASSEKDARAQAVRALAPMAPFSQPELLTALSDPVSAVRVAAARALAAGEGRGLAEAARARVEDASPPPLDERRAWLEVLGDVGEEGCDALVLQVLRDETQPAVLRAAALRAVPLCAPARALDEAQAAYATGPVPLKAAAVRVAGVLLRKPHAAELVEAALAADEPSVVAAAVDGVVGLHLSRLAPRVLDLIEQGAPEVRVAAARASAQLDPAPAAPRLGRCMKRDPLPEVRAVCADVLGAVGGAPVIGALLEVAKADPDAHVKFVARESLRRLGVVLPP